MTANTSRKNSLEKPALATDDVIVQSAIELEKSENKKNMTALNNMNYLPVGENEPVIPINVIEPDAANYDPPKVVSNGTILQPTEIASKLSPNLSNWKYCHICCLAICIICTRWLPPVGCQVGTSLVHNF